MTDEQINRAIAEACGWSNISSDGVVGRAPNETSNRVMFVPLYCTNLNAMHEAEKTLSKEQIEIYCDALWPKQHGWWWAIHTTARQRAEAFLRVLGKWKEVQK